MKLKYQILLLASLALLVPALLISSVSIYMVKSGATADIQAYRDEEMSSLKQYVKHITDIAYGVIDVRYKQLNDSLSLYKRLDSTLSDEQILEHCLAELAHIRFDKGEGYFWVTDNTLPFPKMLMHAEKQNLKGVVLDDPKYNVERYERKNIYQLRASLCNLKGECYVEYTMKKPGSDQIVNKLSYSRLYGPLGWIISTGFYTDQIDALVAQKKEQLSSQIRQIVLIIAGIAAFILITGLSLSFYFSKQLTNAILKIRDTLRLLAGGTQTEEVLNKRKDEVGEMTESLNLLVRGLRRYTAFAKKIGEGDLSQEFTALSEKDVLGNELLEMRSNLRKAAEDKAVRDWATEGLAVIVDVLRRNTADTGELAHAIVKQLVTYMGVNQGALFLTREDAGGKYLELTAAYAYTRRKFLSKRVAIGEGLIGQCVLERRTIYLTQVPKDYVSITSGLGDAPPQTVLIVPLIHNEIVYGVVELAAFKKLKQHEVSFIEKVGDSIASTISTVEVNERTKRLLAQSQQMSEELKAQEEELRQNQEELQATQEQMRRRQVELERENELLKEERKSIYQNG